MKALSFKVAMGKFWGDKDNGLCSGFYYLASGSESKIWKMIVDVANFIVEALDEDEVKAV